MLRFGDCYLVKVSRGGLSSPSPCACGVGGGGGANLHQYLAISLLSGSGAETSQASPLDVWRVTSEPKSALVSGHFALIRTRPRRPLKPPPPVVVVVLVMVVVQIWTSIWPFRRHPDPAWGDLSSPPPRRLEGDLGAQICMCWEGDC